MTLADYLAATGTTLTALAAKAGLPLTSVSRWARGQSVIPAWAAARIRAATDGRVGVEDWPGPDELRRQGGRQGAGR